MSWFIRDFNDRDQMLIDGRGRLFNWPTEGPAVEIRNPEECGMLEKVRDQRLLFGISATIFECSGGDKLRRIIWGREAYFEPYKLRSEGEQ